MRKLPFVLLFTFLSSTVLFAQKYIKGNHNVTKTTRNVGSFSEIKAGGSVNVFLTQGNKNEIVIEADENLHDYIITEVSGKKLTIKNKEQIRDAEKLDVYVTFKEINALEGSGATDIVALNKIQTSKEFFLSGSGATDVLLKKGFSSNSLELDGSGSADIEMVNVSTNNVTANLSGSVDLEIDGKAETLTIGASGSSDFLAKQLIVSSATISTSGSSDVSVHTTNSISVNATGSSDVYYWGNPSNKMINSSRAADVMLKQ